MSSKLLILFFLLAQRSNSIACSCIGKRTVKAELIKSDAVFLGKVLSKKEFLVQDSSLPIGYKLHRAEFKILLLKEVKGDFTKDTVIVITGIGRGDCGIDFMIGKDYIIYSTYSTKYFGSGREVTPFLYTNICTRTIINNNKERKKLKQLS
jgi:hypothetical protein